MTIAEVKEMKGRKKDRMKEDRLGRGVSGRENEGGRKDRAARRCC